MPAIGAGLSACVADAPADKTLQLQSGSPAGNNAVSTSDQTLSSLALSGNAPPEQISADGVNAAQNGAAQAQQPPAGANQQLAALEQQTNNKAGNTNPDPTGQNPSQGQSQSDPKGANAAAQSAGSAGQAATTGAEQKPGEKPTQNQLTAAQKALESSHAAAKAPAPSQLVLAGTIPETISAGGNSGTAQAKSAIAPAALASQSELAPKANAAVNRSLSQRDSEDLASLNTNPAGTRQRRNARDPLNAERGDRGSRSNSPRSGSVSGLPGVRSRSQIFGIEDASEVEEQEQPSLLLRGRNSRRNKGEENQEYQVASAAGVSAGVINGLRLQTDRVNVACLKAGVIGILNAVERKYGQKPIITSGYRSPNRNRRAGGARNSMHIYCKAVDIQVPGVSKWALAKYLRSLPSAGGVGTYCRTKSVHVDTGPRRNWNQPCRRSSSHRRKRT